jgi:prepilin-type N-terminal cleavage/methylation domain-containing protein
LLRKKEKQTGFTIVELLIVITVIAILAALIAIIYTGVQNNANDVAIKTDLRNIAGKLEEFRTSSGNSQYPTATQAELQGLIKVSKSSYLSGISAGTMSYCRSDTNFTVFGRSTSMNSFVYSSKLGLQSVLWTGSLNDPTNGQCTRGGVSPTDPGFSSIWLLKGTGNPEGAGWQPWIN